MAEQPPWEQSVRSAEQRKIDGQIAATMGITLKERYEIGRQVEGDVQARDAVPQSQQVVDSNPECNKGFGSVMPKNTIQPGEIRAYYDVVEPGRGMDEERRGCWDVRVRCNGNV